MASTGQMRGYIIWCVSTNPTYKESHWSLQIYIKPKNAVYITEVRHLYRTLLVIFIFCQILILN
jgi:hypothetical protein